MENSDFPKHTSVPSVLKKNENKHATTSYSSVTHPSMGSRNKDLMTIFKKINSGDAVLSRIPLRLDPNIEFSDDEDEEPAATVVRKPTAEDFKNKCGILEGKENQKKFLAETMKTPEPPRISRNSLNKASYIHEKKMPDGKNHPEKLLPSCFSSSIGEKRELSKALSLTQQSHKPMLISKSSLNVFSKPNDGILHTVLKQNDNVLHAVSKQKPSDLPSKDVVHKQEDSITKVKNDASLPNETIEVNNKVYNILSLLGSGGSCKVYSVYDIHDKTRVAIKRVNLKDTDPIIRKGFEQEIEYLKKMQNSNRVIKMYDYEYCEDELLLVLEHGDIDFAKYLSNEAKLKRLTPLMIKFYWAQMIEAVADIHKYGIVHSDLKPANFLLVAGSLKLIDFGIATSVPEDKTSTFRDTQVGTLNYMSPEAITQMSADSKQQRFKIGVKSDVWSLGCILYNLVYGTTPFHNFKSIMQKIYAITNPSYEIPFTPLSDPLLLDVLKSCLKRDPKERSSVEELLNHPYLAEENTTSTSEASVNPNPELQNVLKQMQILTPRRMRYITQVVQELSVKSDT